MVYKCIYGLTATELIEKIVHFRHSDILILNQLQFNSKYGRRSFSYIGPRLWNEIPSNMKQITDIEVFKKHLKTFMYTNFEDFKAKVFKYVEI